MVLVAEEGEVVAPGDRLGSEESCVAGEGTHIFDGYVVASILGKLKCEFPSVSLEQGGRGRPTLSIGLGASAGAKALAIGDEVLCRVRRLNPRYATATIVCKGSAPLTNEFSGLLRVQDVRATEIDKVTILSSFRPGDIVRAEVISLGESQSLLLSTAKENLGVVHATSPDGHPMVPISLTEFQCPVSKRKEPRKVAKPAS